MNIVEAIHDENLFRPFLGTDLSSWKNWLVALRVLYGLETKSATKELIRHCTGRSRKHLPAEGFDTALFLTGRRSGKSRSAAIIGAFEATLAGHETKLAKGEIGVVPIISPSRAQSRIVRDYTRAIFQAPLLAKEVIAETQNGFDLRSGVRIEILTGDWRLVRGYTLLAAVIDEACFFGYDSESKVKSDSELIRAIEPGLASVGGKLIAISSPYARKGWCYSTHKRHFANDRSKILVWNCASRVMNPTLSQQVINDALAEDLASAKAEFLGEFRDDVILFLPREVVEAAVVTGRKELLPRKNIEYRAFADLSGGRSDDAALAIGHLNGETVVVDYLRRWRPPFNPRFVIGQMVQDLKRYGVRRVSGDNYAASFVSDGFADLRIKYDRIELNASQCYLELLPHICSSQVELPDNPTLIDQLANLERRTRSGGRDIVDHPTGGHDDLAVCVAGLTTVVTKCQKLIGSIL